MAAMARRTGNWQRVGSVAPAPGELSATRKGELALQAAWQRVAGRPLASRARPRIERRTLVVEVAGSDWLRTFGEVVRRLATGVAAALEENPIERYELRDHEGHTLDEGKLGESAIRRARARLGRERIGEGREALPARRPLIAEPELDPADRRQRLAALRDRYLEARASSTSSNSTERDASLPSASTTSTRKR